MGRRSGEEKERRRLTMLLLCNNNAINSISGGLVTKIEVYLLATRTVVRIVLICSLFYCVSRPACIELKPSQSESQSQSQPVLVDEANQTTVNWWDGMPHASFLLYFGTQASG
jgi:hypothetical protein